MLAATGLAESCWLMYADQPTGLGPDEVLMQQGELWIKEMQKWRKRGRRGIPPGVGEKEPVHSTQMKDRDYALRRPSYVLRPEVRVLDNEINEILPD